MKKRVAVLLSAIFMAFSVLAGGAIAGEVIKMSTTTSTQNSGLLDVLLPEFTKDTGIQVKVFAKGTGAAIRDGIDGNVDIILTTGGTGLGPSDVTPEATLSVVDKVVPGLAEAMRAETFHTTPFATLSRAVAGVRGKCLIINLPGSPKAVRECLEVILPVIPHAIQIIKGEVTEHTDIGRSSAH